MKNQPTILNVLLYILLSVEVLNVSLCQYQNIKISLNIGKS